MGIEQIERDIDILLRYMNQSIESRGLDIESAFFAFTEEQDAQHLIGTARWTTEHLKKVIKICIRRTFLKYTFEHNRDYCQEVSLTLKGQIRAVFAEEDIHRDKAAV